MSRQFYFVTYPGETSIQGKTISRGLWRKKRAKNKEERVVLSPHYQILLASFNVVSFPLVKYLLNRSCLLISYSNSRPITNCQSGGSILQVGTMLATDSVSEYRLADPDVVEAAQDKWTAYGEIIKSRIQHGHASLL